MKNFFPKLNVKDLCILGLLTSITVLLSVFCTFRIGTVIKIPFKFISVFVTGALYGPVLGGTVAAIGDLMNCILAPSGPIIPQITAIEFLSGFVYGIFFFRSQPGKRKYIIRVVLCVAVQFAIDMFVTTQVFIFLGWYPSFAEAFSLRITAGLTKLSLQCAVLLTLRTYLNKFRQFTV